MKKQLFLLTAMAFFFSVISNAQTEQTLTTIAKGRILTADGGKIPFNDFSFGTENHQYREPSGGKGQTIPADNVMRVEQQTGNEAGKWALWLGLSGLVGSVLGVMSAKSDVESLGGEVNGTPIILGFTAGSALIGAAIGAGKKKYKTVYSNPKYGYNSSAAPVQVGLTCSPHGGIGIGLNYGF